MYKNIIFAFEKEPYTKLAVEEFTDLVHISVATLVFNDRRQFH